MASEMTADMKRNLTGAGGEFRETTNAKEELKHALRVTSGIGNTEHQVSDRDNCAVGISGKRLSQINKRLLTGIYCRQMYVSINTGKKRFLKNERENRKPILDKQYAEERDQNKRRNKERHVEENSPERKSSPLSSVPGLLSLPQSCELRSKGLTIFWDQLLIGSTFLQLFFVF